MDGKVQGGGWSVESSVEVEVEVGFGCDRRGSVKGIILLLLSLLLW